MCSELLAIIMIHNRVRPIIIIVNYNDLFKSKKLHNMKHVQIVVYDRATLKILTCGVCTVDYYVM